MCVSMCEYGCCICACMCTRLFLLCLLRCPTCPTTGRTSPSLLFLRIAAFMCVYVSVCVFVCVSMAAVCVHVCLLDCLLTCRPMCFWLPQKECLLRVPL